MEFISYTEQLSIDKLVNGKLELSKESCEALSNTPLTDIIKSVYYDDEFDEFDVEAISVKHFNEFYQKGKQWI